MNWLKNHRASLRLAISLIAGVAAAVFLRADFFDAASQELVALFGLLMAAVLPTMILTATVLRSGDLSVKRIAEYRSALVGLVRLWAGLFLLALLACAVVIFGKTAEWSLPLPLPSWLGSEIELAPMLNFFIIGLLSFLGMRASTVVTGIIGLINLSAEVAQGEARKRDEAAQKEVDESIAGIKPRRGFGRHVNLKH